MIIIYLLAIYGLSYIIRNLSGPFHILDVIRQKLMGNKLLGVFFYQLLDCPWCLGFHCGWIIYLLGTNHFNYKYFILWALAGSTIAALGDVIFNFLSKEK